MPQRIPAEKFIGWRCWRLECIGVAEKRGRRDYLLLRCDCGNIKEISKQSFNTMNVQSCGCAQLDHINSYNASDIERGTHNMSKSKEYVAWKNMKARCDDINQQAYKNYGGRGITYCDEWSSFENFYKEMGECPQGMTLERLEVNGNYSRSNCKWASNKEQSVNRRKVTNSSSPYKGVVYSKSESKFKASARKDDKYLHLGYSDDPLLLACRFDKANEFLRRNKAGLNITLGLIDNDLFIDYPNDVFLEDKIEGFKEWKENT